MRMLIHGGTVVTETGTFRGDVLVEDGKIQEVLKDADGSFKAFSEGIKQRFFDTSTLQIASIS